MASSARSLHVVGGGLAGLATGIAARSCGIPVRLDEAGTLPRHRVCGEFLTGLSPATVHALGLEDVLRDAVRLTTIAWFHRSRLVREDRLPTPAFGISRHRLDFRLAQLLRNAGADTHFGSRVMPKRTPTLPKRTPTSDSRADTHFGSQADTHFAGSHVDGPEADTHFGFGSEADTHFGSGVPPGGAGPGTVWATGRRPVPASPWLGLKLHLLRAPGDLAADLEIHLGDRAYVGLSRVEDGRINVAGLFRRRPRVTAPPDQLLFAYLEAAGLGTLARRIGRLPVDPQSVCAVAGLDYRSGQPSPAGSVLTLGDQAALIPPFTGHGMALALEAGAIAGPILAEWARGKVDWPIAVAKVNRQLVHQSCRRRWARTLHPFLIHPTGQRLLVTWAGWRAFPFATLYRLTHGPVPA